MKAQLSSKTVLFTPAVCVLPKAASKRALIGRLVRQMGAQLGALSVEDITEQIAEREKAGSTALETGLSLPHIRLDEIDSLCASAAFLRQPLVDPETGHAIQLMCVFASPKKPAYFQQHLRFLAALAATFTPEFIEELAALQTDVQERLKQALQACLARAGKE